MVWQNHRKSGGMDAVSTEIGTKIYIETCIHDDGVIGYGGERIVAIGAMRAGKTTLGLTTLPKFHFLPKKEKGEYLGDRHRNPDDLIPETIIYRGRKLDYWNAYTKQNYKKCFPDAKPRDLRVFVWHEDDIVFFEESKEDEVMKPIPGLAVYNYTSQEDLYNNLLEGGINVVYVPNDYKLSNLLKRTLNEMRMLSEDDPDWYHPDDVVSVINETFWYDLFYYMQEIENSRDDPNDKRRRLKSIAFFFDEAHQIFPANEPKPFWYLIDDFAENALIDTGRMNMTIYANVHALNLMYWKVLQRFNILIWLPGSKPDKSYSMVTYELARSIRKGAFIIEEKMRQFGKMKFGRIPHQPFTVLAKGAV